MASKRRIKPVIVPKGSIAEATWNLKIKKVKKSG